MSLFDSLTSLAGNVLGDVMKDALPNLLQNGLAGTDFGNLDGLLTKFREAGLGDQVSSWLGQGTNLPISADDVSNALSSGQLADLAGRLGLSQETISQAIAAYLPSLVDKLSPNGVLEQP